MSELKGGQILSVLFRARTLFPQYTVHSTQYSVLSTQYSVLAILNLQLLNLPDLISILLNRTITREPATVGDVDDAHPAPEILIVVH